MSGAGGRPPGIFTRLPFFTAAVKMLGTVNTGTGRRPRRDHQVASSIPAATAATEDRTRWPTRALTPTAIGSIISQLVMHFI